MPSPPGDPKAAGQKRRRRKVAKSAPPASSLRGRPQRLAHLLPGSPQATRLARANTAAEALLSKPAVERRIGEVSSRSPECDIVMALGQPDWIQQTLTVTGPGRDLADFRGAAIGSGRIPWQLDLRNLEEDWANRLMAVDITQGQLSPRELRILTRALRDAVETRASREEGRTLGWACPFDLHALVPVPVDLLARGPDHADVFRWLWENWGTTWPLRGVENITELMRLRGWVGPEALVYRFWSADWTPWRAIEVLRAKWPSLAMTVCLQLDMG